jgi:hypothetical protein
LLKAFFVNGHLVRVWAYLFDTIGSFWFLNFLVISRFSALFAGFYYDSTTVKILFQLLGIGLLRRMPDAEKGSTRNEDLRS